MTLRLIGIPGSLRTQSQNRRLLETMRTTAPPSVNLEIDATFIDLPLYCEDLELEPPSVIRALWQQVSCSDGLIVATPEYNQSIPGPLKNALDWLSRAPGRTALTGRPVLVMGASAGPGGTRLAQQQVRSALSISGAAVMPAPFLFHGDTQNRPFDVVQLRTILDRFIRWLEAVRHWDHDEPLKQRSAKA